MRKLQAETDKINRILHSNNGWLSGNAGTIIEKELKCKFIKYGLRDNMTDGEYHWIFTSQIDVRGNYYDGLSLEIFKNKRLKLITLQEVLKKEREAKRQYRINIVNAFKSRRKR